MLRNPAIRAMYEADAPELGAGARRAQLYSTKRDSAGSQESLESAVFESPVLMPAASDKAPPPPAFSMEPRPDVPAAPPASGRSMMR
eukprot:SAG22_NODE_119_length_19257_cov_43.260413_27_plen_87_part_00